MSYGPPEGGPHNHRVRLKAGPTISVRPEADPTLAAFTTAALGQYADSRNGIGIDRGA